LKFAFFVSISFHPPRPHCHQAQHLRIDTRHPRDVVMPLLVGRHHLVVLSLLLFCLAALIQLNGVFDANNAYVQQAAFVLMWFPAAVAVLEYAYASISTYRTIEETPTTIQENNNYPVLTHPPPPSGSDVATSPP